MSTENTLSFGEVKLKMDPKDIIKSFDSLNELDSGGWQKMALSIGLKVEPFDKSLLRPVLMGAIQNGWHQLFSGKVPQNLKENQQVRVAHYHQKLDMAKNGQGDLLVKARKAPSSAAPKAVFLHRLLAATKEKGLGPKKDKGWNSFSGQKFIIVQTMLDLGAGPGGKGVSVADITAKQKAYPGIVAPSDKNVAFHVNAFAHEGVTEKVDDKGDPLREQEPPKQETKAKEPVKGKK